MRETDQQIWRDRDFDASEVAVGLQQLGDHIRVPDAEDHNWKPHDYDTAPSPQDVAPV
jgi:hypothetical protein